MSRRNYTRYIVERGVFSEAELEKLRTMPPGEMMQAAVPLSFRELPSEDEVQRLQDTINALRMAP